MKIPIILLMVVMAAPLAVNADGGAVQLHEVSGPFVVTVFATPEPLQVGPIDTSVLVQDRETGAVILDATVNLVFRPIGGASPSLLSRATHGQARNKLLQAVTIDVPVPGWWTIQIFVCRDRKDAVLATKFLVMPAPARLTTIWPFLILPLFAIGVFTLHQTLRTRLR